MRDPWSSLYRLGAGAAIAVLALVPLQMAVYVASPPPVAVDDWFALLAKSPLLALVHLDVLLIVDNVLVGLVFLATCLTLRRTQRPLVTLAALFELAAVLAYFSSNVAFQMLELGERLRVAGSDSERAAIHAAGQAMLATMEGSGFVTGYLLAAVAFLLLSVAMLRSRVFGRPTAWIGVVFGVTSLVPASWGTPGLVFAVASLVPMWLWLALVARRLLGLARRERAPYRDEASAGFLGPPLDA